jgi:hypothetical protein
MRDARKVFVVMNSPRRCFALADAVGGGAGNKHKLCRTTFRRGYHDLLRIITM